MKTYLLLLIALAACGSSTTALAAEWTLEQRINGAIQDAILSAGGKAFNVFLTAQAFAPASPSLLIPGSSTVPVAMPWSEFRGKWEREMRWRNEIRRRWREQNPPPLPIPPSRKEDP